MKVIFSRTTVDMINNMAAVELDHHGVAPELAAEFTSVQEITHLKHFRVQRVGDNYEYEVSDEFIVKTAHLYARAARILVPLIKPIAFAIKGFIKGIDQLKELMPHVDELDTMLVAITDDELAARVKANEVEASRLMLERERNARINSI